MAEPVLMPPVGQDIKTATIVGWLKKENDDVRKGEVIAIVESDKAAFDVEADTIVAREMMTATPACDHKAGDGTYAA